MVENRTSERTDIMAYTAISKVVREGWLQGIGGAFMHNSGEDGRRHVSGAFLELRGNKKEQPREYFAEVVGAIVRSAERRLLSAEKKFRVDGIRVFWEKDPNWLWGIGGDLTNYPFGYDVVIIKEDKKPYRAKVYMAGESNRTEVYPLFIIDVEGE